jgi:protein-S-isoprenylcysteine O-methyltransferase Ste14
MYLGHLIFFAGIAATLGSWIALAVLAFHVFWFDRARARG